MTSVVMVLTNVKKKKPKEKSNTSIKSEIRIAAWLLFTLLLDSLKPILSICSSSQACGSDIYLLQ